MVHESASSSSSFTYGDFTPVKSRKNRKNNKKIKARPSPLLSLQRNREELRGESDNDIIGPSPGGIGAQGGAGLGGSWFSRCSHTISQAWHDHRTLPADNKEGASSSASARAEIQWDVLCLGLGSPSQSQNANAQLAFILEICQDLSIGHERIAVYDPVFSEEDLSLFAELGVQVLCDNKKGAYPLSAPTLCFMLHCDKELYDAILKANWDKDRIRRLLLIGNSLTDYLDRNSTKALQVAVPHLFRIAPHLESQPLSASRTWPTAFNNTCVQVYRKTAKTPSSGADLDSHERDDDEQSNESDDIFANGDADECESNILHRKSASSETTTRTAAQREDDRAESRVCGVGP